MIADYHPLILVGLKLILENSEEILVIGDVIMGSVENGTEQEYLHSPPLPHASQHVIVGKRTIELSNLKKVLYPDDHIVKAELIQYYLAIALTILSHIKGRPLSLVRFPDGIGGEMFFQKNRPQWAIDGIDFIALGSEKVFKYVELAQNKSR